MNDWARHRAFQPVDRIIRKIIKGLKLFYAHARELAEEIKIGEESYISVKGLWIANNTIQQ